MKKTIIGISLFVLLILGACSADTSTDTAANFTPPEEITENNTKLFSDNGVNGITYSKLLKGTIEESQEAVILTDESCVEDSNGITHCFNNIRLENGEEIRVNSLHVMQKVPCLSPEEKVNIAPSENGYVKITRNL